jgi:hypothetical protein
MRFPTTIPVHQTENDSQYQEEIHSFYQRCAGTDLDKITAFPKFVTPAEIGRFLAKSKLFEEILHVHGWIVECGVFLGGGLMTWAQLSAVLEPLNHVRRIVGFDSFTGFTQVSSKDQGSANEGLVKVGGYSAPVYDELVECLRLFDLKRPIGHIPRVLLEKGDALKTIPAYLEKCPHAVVALLYLDFDLYEPTKVAIETFLPRMPKGAIIAFDELGHETFPGETLALLDTVGIRNLRIQRFPFMPQISYAVLE